MVGRARWVNSTVRWWQAPPGSAELPGSQLGCTPPPLPQYSYSKHLHVRDGGEPLLLPAAAAEAGGASAAALPPGEVSPQHAERHAELDGYHFLTSRLFWSGVALQLLGLGLISLTVYTLLAPPV